MEKGGESVGGDRGNRSGGQQRSALFLRGGPNFDAGLGLRFTGDREPEVRYLGLSCFCTPHLAFPQIAVEFR